MKVITPYHPVSDVSATRSHAATRKPREPASSSVAKLSYLVNLPSSLATKAIDIKLMKETKRHATMSVNLRERPQHCPVGTQGVHPS